MRGTEAPVGGIRPWIVWLAATLTFVAAMFSRTSSGDDVAISVATSSSLPS